MECKKESNHGVKCIWNDTSVKYSVSCNSIKQPHLDMFEGIYFSNGTIIWYSGKLPVGIQWIKDGKCLYIIFEIYSLYPYHNFQKHSFVRKTFIYIFLLQEKIKLRSFEYIAEGLAISDNTIAAIAGCVGFLFIGVASFVVFVLIKRKKEHSKKVSERNPTGCLNF